MSVVAMLSIVVLVFFAGLAIALALAFGRNYLGRTVSVPAHVGKKSSFPSPMFRMRKAQTDYVLAFDCPDGRRSFYVSAWLYDDVLEGQSGTLTYRGTRLIDFSRADA